MRFLILNAGSSTLKLSVVDESGHRFAGETLEHHATHLDPADLARWASPYGPFDAVGHRIVHGGVDFTGPATIDDDVVKRIDALTPLAPLHQPAGLAGVQAAQTAFPGVANVACFDTAFHATLAPEAATYAVPEEWRSRYGVRRFGFHGLSHAWASRRAAEVLGRDVADLRIVTCHLGGGSSLCAVAGGRSRDTTMGFTPLEGVVMATRSGTVDPGLVLWLLQYAGMNAAEVSDGLEHRGGLAGLSGTSGDVRDVEGAATRGDPSAVLAIDVWVHRLVAEIAAMAAALGGVDAMVFTGGIGEHSPDLRARAAARLGFLGVVLDPERNAVARGDWDGDISRADAHCRVLVVKAGEDLQIGAEVASHLVP